MLQEVLLCLAGHQSPLLDFAGSSESPSSAEAFPLLSTPEAAQLRTVARLANVHRRLQSHAARVSAKHPSIVCRAVAISITSSYLRRFQQKILDVESSILNRDAGIVGAYNIVPLSGVVAEFEDWHRSMDWLWGIACYMEEPKGTTPAKAQKCSGADIINKLREESQTGYPDIEHVATSLSKAAEAAWMRQLSPWILHGRLPDHGADDFFVQPARESQRERDEYRLVDGLIPKFVSYHTASSVLFIGKSLNQSRRSDTVEKPRSGTSIIVEHIQQLSGVSLPIHATQLSNAVSAIRLSISRNILQQLLPMDRVAQTLAILQDFFLLREGVFASTLIQEADKFARSRSTPPSALTPRKKAMADLAGLVVKPGEMNNVLDRTWSSMFTQMDDDEFIDEKMDSARDLIRFSTPTTASRRSTATFWGQEESTTFAHLSEVAFNDFLFSTPAAMSFDIRYPLDMFLTDSDIEIYSIINAYLIAIRRGHLRLTELWKYSMLRRTYSTPLRESQNDNTSGRQELESRRRRSKQRARRMRQVWAACSAAVFLLAELGSYLEAEVIEGSCMHFRRWMTRPGTSRHGMIHQPQALSGSRVERSSADMTFSCSVTTQTPQPPSAESSVLHDPETLACAHRKLLSSFSFALLLTDQPYTRCLRTLLQNADALISNIKRLQSLQQTIDLESDANVALGTLLQQEEAATMSQLDLARETVDRDMKALIARLRAIDAERISGVGTWRPTGPALFATGRGGPSEFEPARAGGVDRLLMKLDFGQHFTQTGTLANESE